MQIWVCASWYPVIYTLSFIFGFVLVIPYHLIPYYFWDNKEYEENTNLKELKKKIRLRAILYSNLSVVILVFNILVILIGFYVLLYPPKIDGAFQLTNVLTVQISASVMLIFLVQILFRVFKYLLRVAAFYHGLVDAVEFHQHNKDVTQEQAFALFSPDKFDISDIQDTSLLNSLTDFVKKK